MPCYGNNNDGIMPFTKRLCAGFKKNKNKKNKNLTDTAMLISELTRFDSFYIFFPRNSSCLYYVGRQTKCSDYLDPVLSVLKFIINIDCL